MQVNLIKFSINEESIMGAIQTINKEHYVIDVEDMH